MGGPLGRYKQAMSNLAPTVRLFRSDFLERLTHVHPITPLLVWIPIIALLFLSPVSSMSLTQILTWSGIGVLGWTLFEYLMHRYFFHFPARSRFGKRIVYLVHGIHHDTPQDATRLLIPPVPGLMVAGVLYLMLRLVLVEPICNAFFGGFLIGYLCYDYIHFATHHFTPKTRLGKALKQNHMDHHFVKHHALWGVSSPLWDHVFRTFDEKKS